MIYGTTSYKQEADVTDLVGFRKLVYSRLWQPTHWPLSEEELQQQKPEPFAGVGRAMILIGDETRQAPGGLRTYWTFDGIQGDGASVTFKDRARSFDYQFQPSLEQVDIRKHPRIRQLMDQYGGQLDPASLEIIWPLTIDKKGGNTAAAVGAGKSGEVQNPMFGRNEFLDVAGVYTFRYASLNPPGMSGAGKVFKTSSLPGRPPTDLTDRDWLMGGSPYKCRGIAFDITEIYLLSAPGGWPEPIHRLFGKAGAGGGGLTTGGLTTGSL
ncbi:MAG TPA: hypothetical protein VF614_16655 [Chthoniobacteraceae bacterium]|jgi:hypothetical protein